MELKEGSRVMTSDGFEMGKISRIVINPVTRQVTHIVAKKGFFMSEEKVVPLEKIISAQVDAVILALKAEECRELPPYEETLYGSPEETRVLSKTTPVSGEPPYYSLSLPFGIQISMYLPDGLSGEAGQKQRHIPHNTISLKEGAQVISADGDPVGQVEEIITDTETHGASHFLIRLPGFHGVQKLIPVKWVRYMRENEVFLGVRDYQIEKLPVYRPGV